MIRNRAPLRILIVEDNPGDFLLVEDYLNEQLTSANLIHLKKFDGFWDAIDQQEQTIDLVLLDLFLPDISKEKLLEEVKTLTEHIPVIILTGYSDADFAVRSLSIGVADYLIKDTINSLVLYKSIIYAVERHRFNTSLRTSEKRYTDLFELSPAPMMVYSIESLDFLNVNEAAIKHYGFSEAEFLSMSINDIIGKAEVGNPKEEMDQNATETLLDQYVTHRKKDGSIIYVETQVNKIDHQGTRAEIMLATDVTEKREQLLAIEDQNNNLREIARTQSHVVRAPVARLIGLVNLILNHDLSEGEKTTLLNHIKDSADEIDLIIKDIVRKSRSILKSKQTNVPSGIESASKSAERRNS